MSQILNSNSKLGYIGAGLMGFGVFTPILSLPIVGSITYFNNGKGDGVVLLLLSLVGAYMIYCNQSKVTLTIGLVSTLLVVYTSWNVMNAISEAKKQLESELEGNLFSGLASGLMGTVQMQWGWIFLYVGAIALTLSGYLSLKGQAELTQDFAIGAGDEA